MVPPTQVCVKSAAVGAVVLLALLQIVPRPALAQGTPRGERMAALPALAGPTLTGPPTQEQMHRMMDVVNGPGTGQRMHEAMGPEAEKLMDQHVALMGAMRNMMGMMQGQGMQNLEGMKDFMPGLISTPSLIGNGWRRNGVRRALRRGVQLQGRIPADCSMRPRWREGERSLLVAVGSGTPSGYPPDSDKLRGHRGRPSGGCPAAPHRLSDGISLDGIGPVNDRFRGQAASSGARPRLHERGGRELPKRGGPCVPCRV